MGAAAAVRAAAVGGVDEDAVARALAPHGIDAAAICAQADRFDGYMADAAVDAGWQQVSTGELSMFYQHEAWSSVHSFRARCTLTCPPENLVACAREFDLIKTWNKHCSESLLLAEPGPMEVTAFATLAIPWPLPNADVLAGAIGVDALDEYGVLVVEMTTPKGPPPGVTMPPTWGKHMKVELMPNSYIMFEPLAPATPGGPMRTRVCMSVHSDAGIKNLPSLVITFVLKILAPYIFREVVRVVDHAFTDPASQLAARIRSRPELYSVVRTRIAEHMAAAAAGVGMDVGAGAGAGAAGAGGGEKGAAGGRPLSPSALGDVVVVGNLDDLPGPDGTLARVR
ncbi:hypothetical protein FOA52_008618 [Chlamydomonas sp. UWO 241]|nr:hypothetical protein FOA52_008618 [Chlamydomonas sp. UWO 241]